ncbi:MAG: hypothetical protein EZS28_019994, partial [Streblomastix strix]
AGEKDKEIDDLKQELEDQKAKAVAEDGRDKQEVIDELGDKLKSCEDEILQLEEDKMKNQDIIDALQKQLADIPKTGRNTDEIKKKQDQIDELENKLSDKDADIRQLKADKRKDRDAIDDLQQQLDDKLKEKKYTPDDMNKKQDQMDDLKDKLKDKEAEIKALEDGQRRNLDTIDDLRKRIADQKPTDNTKQLEGIKALEDKLKGCDDEISQLEADKKKDQDTIIDLKKQIKDKDRKLNDKDRELDQNDRDIRDKDRSLKNKEKDLKDKENDLKDLEKVIDDLKKQLAQMQDSVKDKDKPNGDSLSARRKQDLVNNLQDKLKKAEDEILQLEDENRKNKDALSNKDRDIREKDRKLNQNDRDLKDKDEDLKDKDRIIDDLKKQLKKGKGSARGPSDQQKDREIDDLKRQLEKEKDKNSDLQKENKDKDKEINDKDKEIKNKNYEIDDKDNEIEDLKKRLNDKGKERKRDDVLDRALAKPDDNLLNKQIQELTNLLRCGQDVEKEQLPAAKALNEKILRNLNVRDDIERAELINVLGDHTQAEDAPSEKFIVSGNILNLIVLADALDDSFSKTAFVVVHPMLQLVKSGFRKQSKQASQALSSLIEESPATKECILSNPDAVNMIDQILVAPIIPQKYIIPIASDGQNIKGEKDYNVGQVEKDRDYDDYIPKDYDKDNLYEDSQGNLHGYPYASAPQIRQEGVEFDPLLDRKIKEHLFPGVVRVEVISAKQLEATSADVKSDPYVVVSFAGQQLKTQPIGDNVNVDLNEMKDFQFDPNQTDDRELKIQVFNRDPYGERDKLIGEQTLPIRPYENNKQNVEVPLEGKGIKSGTQPGVVELSIDYIPEELQRQNYIDKQKKMNKLGYDDSGDEYLDMLIDNDEGIGRNEQKSEQQLTREFSYKRGTIYVDVQYIYRLVDLYNKNHDEPYSLISVGKNKQQSKILPEPEEGSKEANFDEHYQFKFDPEESKARDVKVDVWNYDPIVDREIGTLSLPIFLYYNNRREIERYIDGKYDFEGQRIGKVKLSILYEADEDEKEKQRQEEEEKNKIREKKRELKKQKVQKDKEEERRRAKEVEREAIERAQQQRRAVQPIKEERQESLNTPQQRNIPSVNIYRANANIPPIGSQRSITASARTNYADDDDSSYKPNQQKQRNVKSYLHTSPSQTRIKQGKDLTPQFTPNQQQQLNSYQKTYPGQENTKEKERDRLYTDYDDDKPLAEKERLEKLKSLEDKGYVYKHVKSHILDVLHKCLQEQVDPQKLAVFAPNLTVLKDNASKLLDEEDQMPQEEAEQQLRSLKQFAKQQAQREGKGPEREKEIMQEEQLGGIVTRASIILAYLKDRGIDIDPKDKDKINDQLKEKEKQSQNNIPTPLQLSTVSEPKSIPSSFKDRNIAVDEDNDEKEKQKQREKDKDDQIKQLKDQIDKKQQEKRNLEQDLDDIKDQLQQKDKQIQQLKDKIRDKDNEIDKDEIELFDLKKQLNNKGKEIDDLRRQLDDEKNAEREAEDKDRDIQKLQKQLQNAQRELDDEKDKAKDKDDLERDIQRLQKQLQNAQRELDDEKEKAKDKDDLERDIQRLQKQLQNALRDLENEKEKANQKDKENDDLDREIQKLQKQLQNAQRELDDEKDKAKDKDDLERD